MITCEIDIKFPSFNEYINECKRNKYAGNVTKKIYEESIGWYLHKLPDYERPIKIHFTWVEGKGSRRDPDNICYAKKFILDTMVRMGKITDDNSKYIKGFTDSFETGEETKVIMEIEEL